MYKKPLVFRTKLKSNDQKEIKCSCLTGLIVIDNSHSFLMLFFIPVILKSVFKYFLNKSAITDNKKIKNATVYFIQILLQKMGF